jgi:hypothetical protein
MTNQETPTMNLSDLPDDVEIVPMSDAIERGMHMMSGAGAWREATICAGHESHRLDAIGWCVVARPAPDPEVLVDKEPEQVRPGDRIRPKAIPQGDWIVDTVHMERLDTGGYRVVIEGAKVGAGGVRTVYKSGDRTLDIAGQWPVTVVV